MPRALLYLYILLFVFSFTFTAGVGILSDLGARKRDVQAVHALFSAARPLSIAGGIGWIVTALSGAVLAHAYGVPMDAPWLLGSYAAFAVLILTGFLLHNPWQARVIAASALAKPESRPDLDALLNAPSHRIASGISMASILILVYLMVARPG